MNFRPRSADTPGQSALAVAEALRRAINDFQFVHHERTFWLKRTGVVLPESGTDTFDMALADAVGGTVP